MKRREFVRNLTTGVAVPGTVAGVSIPKLTLTQSKTEWTMVTYFRVKQKHQEFAKIVAEASKGQLLIKLSSRGTDPAWHEPSVPRALVINRSKWDSLPSHLKAIISTAASWLNYQDIIRMVDAAEALEILVNEHGIQLKQFPDSVLKELARVSLEIMRERASQDKLSQAVFESIMQFKQKTSVWTKVSLQPYLTARGGIWREINYFTTYFSYEEMLYFPCYCLWYIF